MEYSAREHGLPLYIPRVLTGLEQQENVSSSSDRLENHLREYTLPGGDDWIGSLSVDRVLKREFRCQCGNTSPNSTMFIHWCIGQYVQSDTRAPQLECEPCSDAEAMREAIKARADTVKRERKYWQTLVHCKTCRRKVPRAEMVLHGGDDEPVRRFSSIKDIVDRPRPRNDWMDEKEVWYGVGIPVGTLRRWAHEKRPGFPQYYGSLPVAEFKQWLLSSLPTFACSKRHRDLLLKVRLRVAYHEARCTDSVIKSLTKHGAKNADTSTDRLEHHGRPACRTGSVVQGSDEQQDLQHDGQSQGAVVEGDHEDGLR